MPKYRVNPGKSIKGADIWKNEGDEFEMDAGAAEGIVENGCVSLVPEKPLSKQPAGSFSKEPTKPFLKEPEKK
jgi:hypothetical protein